LSAFVCPFGNHPMHGVLSLFDSGHDAQAVNVRSSRQIPHAWSPDHRGLFQVPPPCRNPAPHRVPSPPWDVARLAFAPERWLAHSILRAGGCLRAEICTGRCFRPARPWFATRADRRKLRLCF